MKAEDIWMELQQVGMLRVPSTHKRLAAKLRQIAERLEMELTVAYDKRRKEYVLILDPLPPPKPLKLPRQPKIPPISFF